MALPTFPLINPSFFIRKITIPNIDAGVNQRNGPMLERLTSFITQYETECLVNILGYNLYKLFKTEDSPRMTALLSGSEYTDDDGVLRKWNGLVYNTTVSLLANYIYCKFQEDSATQTTGVSTLANTSVGGVSVSPQYKMLDAWNFFSSETKAMVSFLWNQNQATTPVYPEFSLQQCYDTLNFSRPANFLGI